MKNFRKRDSVNQQNSITDMKKELVETRDQLNEAITLHENKAFEASATSESWLARFYTARKALMVSDKPLAAEALGILAEQAKQFALSYAGIYEDETGKRDALKVQKDKINETISRLRILEKSKALNSQLQKISSSIDTPVSDAVSEELNTREVSLLIHTASALIELNTEKTPA